MEVEGVQTIFRFVSNFNKSVDFYTTCLVRSLPLKVGIIEPSSESARRDFLSMTIKMRIGCLRVLREALVQPST